MSRPWRIVWAISIIAGIMLAGTVFDTRAILRNYPGLFLMVFILAMAAYLLAITVFNKKN